MSVISYSISAGSLYFGVQVKCLYSHLYSIIMKNVEFLYAGFKSPADESDELRTAADEQVYKLRGRLTCFTIASFYFYIYYINLKVNLNVKKGLACMVRGSAP